MQALCIQHRSVRNYKHTLDFRYAQARFADSVILFLLACNSLLQSRIPRVSKHSLAMLWRRSALADHTRFRKFHDRLAARNTSEKIL